MAKGKRTRKKRSDTKLPKTRLKELREEQGLLINELANLCPVVSRNTISQIEQKMTAGSMNTHLELIKALGVSADEYFVLSEEPQTDSDESQVVDSRKGFIVEKFPSEPGNIYKIQVASVETFSLKNYLDSDKSVFFYCVQGEIKIHKQQKVHEVKAGDAINFRRAKNISIQNISKLAGIVLAFQV